MIGACGAVSTLTIVGARALARGFRPPVGLLTGGQRKHLINRALLLEHWGRLIALVPCRRMSMIRVNVWLALQNFNRPIIKLLTVC